MALSANSKVSPFAVVGEGSYPVLAGEHIYKGAWVGLNPAGYAKEFVPGDVLVGFAVSESDASSDTANGTRRVNTKLDCEIEYALSGVAISDIGRPVYATDDGTIAFTGHPDAFVGAVIGVSETSGWAHIRVKRLNERAPAGMGSIEYILTGHESFEPTGAVAGTIGVNGFELKSILGLGILANDAENAGIKFSFDATAEIALASVRLRNDPLPIDKGLTFEVDLCVTDSGDAAALDIDFGFGTALTTASEADIDNAAMVQLAAFHMDGASDNVNAQSDNNTTDVASVDTTADNDSTTDTFRKYKIIVRPTGAVEFWVAATAGANDFARKLSTTTFAMLSTANVSAFINMEKTADDTTAELIFRNLRIAAGCAA